MLTTQQLQTLKTSIAADPALNALPNTADDAFTIAAAYNAANSPAWIVWKSTVTRQEILQNGFDWTRLDNLSVGKARIWSDIFVDGIINPSKPNVRAGIDAVWVGTAQDIAVRSAVYVHCKKNATRAEKLFSTGTGNDTTPATINSDFPEGYQITYQDVLSARSLGG